LAEGRELLGVEQGDWWVQKCGSTRFSRKVLLIAALEVFRRAYVKLARTKTEDVEKGHEVRSYAI
jgi:hypothetical protein